MVVCNSAVECFRSCPEWLQFLTVLGGFALYIGIGYLVYRILKDNGSLNSGDEILAGILWPVTVFIGIIYYAFLLITLPFTAARKEDLEKLDERVRDIQIRIAPSASALTQIISTPKFKVGDIITGISGNPGSYKHLYEGCKCRVLSINDRGSMQVLLLDHADKEAHKNQIGKTFKAPARNFTLISSPRRTSRRVRDRRRNRRR